MAFQVNAAEMYQDEKVEYSGAQFEIKYPMVQWAYGNPTLAAKIGGVDASGGWFISEQNIPVADKDQTVAALLAAGWVNDSITTQAGESIPGFYAEAITISHIANRKRWYGESEDGKKLYGDWKTVNEKFGKAKSQFQVMAALKGLESVGPFVLTMKVSAAMAFEGTKTEVGALSRFLNTVIRKADDASKAAMGIKNPTKRIWPFREFWLTVGVNRDAKGKVAFKQYGEGKEASQLSVPVAIGLPATHEAMTVSDLDAFSVGPELREFTMRLHEESISWVEEWKKIQEEQAAAAPAQSNNAAQTAAFAAANGLN